MGFFRKLKLMIWKNCQQQRRKFWLTLFEVLLPLIFASLLLVLRNLIDSEEIDRTFIFERELINIPKAWQLYYSKERMYIGYAPMGFVTDKVIGYAEDWIIKDVISGSRLLNFRFKGFKDEDAMLNFSKHNPTMVNGIVFMNVHNSDTDELALPPHFQYVLRPTLITDYESSWHTDRVYQKEPSGPRHVYGEEYDQYTMTGVPYLQKIMCLSIMKYSMNLTNQKIGEINLTLHSQRMPYPPYIEDQMLFIVQLHLPLFIVLSFILIVIVFTKNLVFEKERKLKESMKLMGLGEAVYFLSWFLTFLIFLVPVIGLFTMFLCYPVVGNNGPILQKSSVTFVFTFLVLYGIAMITFCFMISSIVQKVNVAAAVAGIVYFATYVPYYYLYGNYDVLTKEKKLALSLMFNCAMEIGTKVIGLYEGEGSGVQWSNLFEPGSVDDNVTMFDCFVMLAVDSVLHLLVFWYVDNVRPGDYGVPKPFYFCFTKSYWLGVPVKEQHSVEKRLSDGTRHLRFEKALGGLKPGIKVVNLRKVYGKKAVVDGITMNMYQGQIFVLLGHNGAGKTTLMSMLTGFIPPTSGTAFINGYDITKDIAGVRSSLGLCPQHNILFEQLTVAEHLSFFYTLKGAAEEYAQKEIDSLLNEVQLAEKRDELSKNLSGGQKRKLSVAIALVGGSKVVFLDEPSSGMDPGARRLIWTVLQNHCKGRTMVLSTHYMDEADLLGDQIAIMAAGVVECCGSSTFLKKLYNSGYHLVIHKNVHCDVDALTKVIQTHIPDANLESLINMEITFSLPERDTDEYPSLFNTLDEGKETLGVSGFGISATTLEEVFIKVGKCVHPHFGSRASLKSSRLSKESKCRSKSSMAYNPSKVLMHHGLRPKNPPNSISVDPPNSISVDPRKSISIDPVMLRNQDNEMSVTHAQKQTSNNNNNDGGNEEQRDGGIFDEGVANEGGEEARIVPSEIIKLKEGERRRSTRMSKQTKRKAFNAGYEKRKGMALISGQMWALFIKKALHSWRQRSITLAQLFIPVLFTSFGLFIDTLRPNEAVYDPPLKLTLSEYPPSIVPFMVSADPKKDQIKFFMKKYSFLCKGTQHKVEMVDQSKYHHNLHNFYMEEIESMGISQFNRKVIVGCELEPLDTDDWLHLNVISHFNGQPYHAKAIAIHYVLNAVLKVYLGSKYSIETVIHPLPVKKQVADPMKDVVNLSGGYNIAVFVGFGMAFLTTLFAHYLIKERQVGSKHLQVLSGIGPVTYWIPTFVWDYINYLIPSLFLLLVFYWFDKQAYLGEERAPILVLLLVMFGWAVLPFVYTLQFLFQEPATGVVIIIMLNIFSGGACVVAVYVMSFPVLKILDTAEDVDFIFMIIFPNYSIAKSLMNIYNNHLFNNICKGETCGRWGVEFNVNCCPDTCSGIECYKFQEDYLSYEKPGIGENLFCFLVQGFAYFIILFLIESNILQGLMYRIQMGEISQTERKGSGSSEDEDVTNERQRIQDNSIKKLQETDFLIVRELFKSYGNSQAVDHISVGIPWQECFGLLGDNGAGKTTTFKMLTGDATVTGGNAFLAGYDIIKNIKQVQDQLGYCPQFDAIIDQMTGRETLRMYARMRGVPEDKIPKVIENLMDTLTLLPHADGWAGNYSGGNKRKLSTGMALVGNPPMIMLDEPSAGMDPMARRQLWNVLSDVRESGMTLVLTSHSMEECDALCTRIAIMVNGQFVCLGGPQYLKSRFGQGYTLIVQLGKLEDGSIAPNEPLIDFIKEHFPGTTVFDSHQGYIHFQVPGLSIQLASAFTLMETTKEDFNVLDYSLQPTSLEQVFLAFTRNQITQQVTSKGLCQKLRSLFKRTPVPKKSEHRDRSQLTSTKKGGPSKVDKGEESMV